jgi:LacI family transcriptional regulator
MILFCGGHMTTINDVAKLAGVSKAAISRYLSGTLKPKEETIKRIEAAIAETNYTPNRMAASIRTKTSNTIAIVIPASKNIAFAEISDAINDEIAPIWLLNGYIYNVTKN